MTEHPLRAALDAAGRRLHEEVDAQFRALDLGQQDALEAVRREVEAESEGRWAARLESVRAEWASKLQADVAAVRQEGERRPSSRSQDPGLDASPAVVAARADERQAQLAIVERLLDAIRAMDAARSLTEVLSALLTAAAVEAPRTALFVLNGTELRIWKAIGLEADGAQAPLEDAGLLAEAVRQVEPVVTSAGATPLPPAFVRLPAGRAAMALPLLVGAQPVAVLYADDGAETPHETPASWPEAVQLLARHASASLFQLTAVRAADALRRPSVPAAPAVEPHAIPPADDGSARRYARLLVSEIKLYNEASVRIGRQRRDLLERLRPEIDRARRLYEQRVPPAVDSQGALFQQELIQTLADGDASLLGGTA